MPKKPAPSPEVVDLDNLTKAQLAEKVERTRAHLEAIRKEWPGLVQLQEGERKVSTGRILAQLSAPLRTLFTLLLPKDGKEPALAKVFHVLGDQDRGEDAERFEAALLLRRLDRVEAEQAILAEITTFRRHLADDILNTAEMVVGPGLLSMELARAVSRGNAEHRSALAPVLDALGAMTKKARKRKAEQAGGGKP